MKTMDLQSLQAGFGEIMHGGHCATLANLVQPAGALSPSQSLNVYCGNMRGSLTCALREIYPVCARLLGEVCFDGIAAGYARLHPSKASDLNVYGEKFADFLQLYCDEHGDAEEMHGLACLPELARLEWYYHAAYYTADDPAFDFAAFAEVGESDRERIVFSVNRALTLLSSDYPLYAVWHSHTPADDRSRKEYLCVYRDGLHPALTRLPPQTYHLLSGIIKGETLGALSQRFEGLDRRLPPLLEKGWVTSFTLKADG